MTCPTCHNGERGSDTTTVMLERDVSIVIVRHIPVIICDTCGDYTLDEAVAANVYGKAEAAVDRGAEVEILSYIP